MTSTHTTSAQPATAAIGGWRQLARDIAVVVIALIGAFGSAVPVGFGLLSISAHRSGWRDVPISATAAWALIGIGIAVAAIFHAVCWRSEHRNDISSGR